MIDTRAVMRSLLSLVASVLGRKYGVTVEIGGADAYADGTGIRLPSLPSDVPETHLAMARGYFDHEAGHVRDTDFQALKGASLTPLESMFGTLWRIGSSRFPCLPAAVPLADSQGDGGPGGHSQT